jgi:hypothetical protein
MQQILDRKARVALDLVDTVCHSIDVQRPYRFGVVTGGLVSPRMGLEWIAPPPRP